MAELPPPAVPQPDAAPRNGKGLRIALAVSVTVNLIVAGLVAGAVLRGPPEGRDMRDREVTFGPFAEAMRPEDRRALREEILKRAPDLREMRGQMRDDLQKVAATLRAQPFDAAALTELLRVQETRLNNQLAVGTAALRDFLVALPEADRLAFADRLEQRLKRKDDGKDGGKEGGPQPPKD
jgi:uncharacterized membrane protein